MIFPLVLIGKLIYFISNTFNLGSGGTWPGEVALYFQPKILDYFFSQVKKGIILIAGTNGKTTTARMLRQILTQFDKGHYRVIHNDSGANLLNGLVSAFIQQSSWIGKIDTDWAILEVDENTLSLVISNLKPQTSNKQKVIVVLLNLFRDQLDRYGEIDVIAGKWSKALKKLPKDAKIVLNADDPLIAHLGMTSRPGLKAGVYYFGIDDTKSFLPEMEHATDSIFCLSCGNRLSFEGIYYSHLGIWRCEKCGEKRPEPDISKWSSPLPGLYNQYNTLATVIVAKSLGINDKQIKEALSDFSPAFGRQEEFVVNSKKIKIFLSKNPAGFNESLKTVLSLRARQLLFVLNDYIPDGRDVSWIWDVDFEMIPSNVKVIASGERAFDMGLRIKYSMKQLRVIQNLKEAIYSGLEAIKKGETLYVLPTYSAMLEVRKILKGRKIL